MRKTYQNKWSILGSVVSLVMVLTLIVSCAPAVTPPEEMKTVKVGFLAPLSGEVAAWGLPGLYGVELWVDKTNAAGGIQVGDEKYMVEVIPYDDEYTVSKALLGAKKLVLEDEVSVVLMMAGDSVTATQGFYTKEGMLCFTLGPYDIGPDKPNLLAPIENSTIAHALDVEYIAKTYPELRTAAIVAQDDLFGQLGLAWLGAACEAGNIEVVYKKLYSMETTDFAPVMTAILAQNPDLISFDASYPVFVDLLTEQAYLQGFEGKLEASEFYLPTVLTKVPPDWLEDRGAIAYFPDWDDPNLPEECHEFYAEYISRWPESWGAVSWEYAAFLDVWEYGVKKTGSIEPMAVLSALKASDSVPHPYGEGTWWGKEIWGIDNFLAVPWHTTEVRDGKHRIVSTGNIADWYETGNNGEILLRHLEEAGYPAYG